MMKLAHLLGIGVVALAVAQVPVLFAPRAKPPVRAAAKPAAPAKPAPTPASALAQQWLKSLSLKDLAAQLVIIPYYGDNPNSRTPEYKRYAALVRDLHVGGMIVLNRPVLGVMRRAQPYEMAAFNNRMQKLAKIPLIVGGDFERGSSMRVDNTTKYPHQMAYGAAGDLDLTRYLGAATAREARALGVHWIFAPDADVNNNPDNPIINIRSFGEDPQQVAAHVKAFIEGAHSDPATRVLVTVKHFPGHGDTVTDSHMGLGKVSVDRARMNEVELVPFRAAIKAGVDSVMTAHLAVPAVEPEEIPATVSRKVLTDLLRDELNFSGTIVTDAMDMAGLTKQFSGGEAAVRSLEAGADILLMPPNPQEAVNAVVAAVKSGRLSKERLERSVLRLLANKVRLGLHKERLVNLEQIAENIDSPEASERAQETADRALTLVKNDNNLLPLAKGSNPCVWVLTESRGSQQGRELAQELNRRGLGQNVQLLDPRTPVAEGQELLGKAAGCGVHVLAPFVQVGAYRGDVALAGTHPAFVAAVQATGKPVVLIAFGNPYLLRSFPQVNAYLATFSTAPTAETAAAKALAGSIAIGGKMPVTIPGLARLGDGLTLAPAAGASARNE